MKKLELKFKLNNLQLFADDDFSEGDDGEDYVPNSIEEVGGMIGTIAEQTIREVSAEDKLAVFDKMPVDNGDTIEQAVVKLAEEKAYDPEGLEALTRKTPGIAVKLFKNWKRTKFDTTVDISLLRKVLKTGKGASDISTKVVSSLSEGDKYAKYSRLKELLMWMQDTSNMPVLGNIELNEGRINYKEILVRIKDTISGFKYVSDSFNGAEIKTRSKAEDIFLLIPYKLKNRLDVEELAGVFNLEKDKLDAHIIELDIDERDFGSKKYTYPVFIVDRWSILSYTRLYEMMDQKNADGLFWNYFLHVERLYAYSPLFNAVAFNVVSHDETEATEETEGQ